MIIDTIKEKLNVGNMSQRMHIWDIWEYKAQDMLLYLTKFGSHLYGTNTENSDTDYKGIYRPSMQNLALDSVKRTLSFSTGDDKSKNTAEDVDVELFSLPYWLELLKKGETIALDLLFSFTNKEAMIYKDPYMGLFFNNINKLVDSDKVKNCAYIRYAKSQSVKYGLKGTRLKAIEKASEYFSPTGCELEDLVNNSRLSDHMHAVVEFVDDSDYCDIKQDDKGLDFLYLCGKMHQSTITVREFLNRVNSAWKEYGHRAKLAMDNEGIDWKAISHCMRAIYQTEELLDSGMITYPLKKASSILRIKRGEVSWPMVEKMIEIGLDAIESMDVKFKGIWDQEFVDQAILKIYDLGDKR
jgi:hypothetical protein